jgi:hypothetical protein
MSIEDIIINGLQKQMKGLKHKIFEVPNDAEGRLFILALKKYIKKPYGIKVFGRKPDKEKLTSDLFVLRKVYKDLPIKYAKSLAVYLTCKNRTFSAIDSINSRVNYYRERQNSEWAREKLSKIKDIIGD